MRIPFSAFQRATDFQPPGAPDDGLTLTEMWGWSLVLPLGTGAPAVDDVGPIDHVIDAFENGLPSGTDPHGVPLGFFTFQGASSSAALATTTTPPAILPAVGTPNTVLQADLDVTSFAGFVHNFSDAPPTTWTPQDWIRYEGFAFWLYGTGSGATLFVDILDNRNPGSTQDDAERFTVAFPDDFTGWRQLRFPFASFTRKDIGNGAPNDGLTLTEVHGWAFGALNTGGPRRYFLDQVTLFGAAGVPPLTVAFTAGSFGVTEGGAASVAVRLSRPLGDEDPEQVSVDYAVLPGTATPERDYVPIAGGTLTFSRGGPTEQAFTVATLQDLKHEGGETAILRLTGASGVELGFVRQAVLNIADDDPFDPNLLDDFETDPVQFEEEGHLALEMVEVQPGDPLALPGQGAHEGLLHVETPILVDVAVLQPQGPCHGLITLAILTTPMFDAAAVDHETVWFGLAREFHRTPNGKAVRHVQDFDGDGDLDLVFHFLALLAGFDCDADRVPLVGRTFAGKRIVRNGYARFGRDFAGSQDWTLAEGLSFWFYGTGSGDALKVQVKDNRAPDPGPAGWHLLWRDEFSGPAGQPPDPRVWNHEIGDGTANNNPRLGQQRAPVLHRQPGQRGPGRPGQARDHRPRGRRRAPLLLRPLPIHVGPAHHAGQARGGLRPRGGARPPAARRRPLARVLEHGNRPAPGRLAAARGRSTSWSGWAARPRRSSAPSTGPATPGETASAASTSSAMTSRKRRTPSPWSASRARSAGTSTASSTIAPLRPTWPPTRGSSTIPSSCSSTWRWAGTSAAPSVRAPCSRRR